MMVMILADLLSLSAVPDYRNHSCQPGLDLGQIRTSRLGRGSWTRTCQGVGIRLGLSPGHAGTSLHQEGKEMPALLSADKAAGEV